MTKILVGTDTSASADLAVREAARLASADDAELRKGLDLTGYFLERHVFWPHNKPLPAARARFMETLQR